MNADLLIFGRTGQVATELARLAPEATFLGRAEADLSQPERCRAAILAHRPKAVINAAAWTAVDKAESEEEAATLVNAAAPAAMAEACAELGIPLVHLSTDYVFSGTGDQPWRPEDPVAPLNAYGRSKLAGETAITTSGCNYVILRTSWVFSAHGSNFVKTMLRLSETRSQLGVVSDQTGGPTPAGAIAEACLLLAAALRNGAPSGIHHFSGAPDTSWAGFAEEIFAQSSLAVSVSPIATSDFPTPAARPLNSRMDCSSLQTTFGIARPDWRAGLAHILNDLAGT